MQSMMQFRRDTQAAARFFPQGSRVQAIDAGDSCLVLPGPGAHTTLSAVPAKNLARLTLFHVVLVSHRVGLIDEQERWALDADYIRSTIDLCAPDFEILELNESSA
jgi:hypothetical protein